jgi:sugar phosphate isomerase/epimerase
MTERLLSVAPLTLSDLRPAAFMRTVAAAGFRHATVRTMAGPPSAQSEQMLSLIRTPQEVAEVKAVMAAEGVSAHEIEAASVDADTVVADFQRGLDWAAELGGRYLVTDSNHPAAARRLDNVGRLAELAQPLGIRLMFEFIPWYAVSDLATAVELAQGVGRGVGVLVDALHFDRSDGDLAELARLDPGLFPYTQLCDAPADRPTDQGELRRQSLEDRLDTGAGGLDLMGLLAALPAGIAVNLEIPSRARVAREGHLAHAVSIRQHAERLLDAADAMR